MIVPEIDFAAIRIYELGWRDVLAEVFVEFEFLASKGVDERGDDLEKAPYCPGDYAHILLCIVVRQYGEDQYRL